MPDRPFGRRRPVLKRRRSRAKRVVAPALNTLKLLNWRCERINAKRTAPGVTTVSSVWSSDDPDERLTIDVVDTSRSSESTHRMYEGWMKSRPVTPEREEVPDCGDQCNVFAADPSTPTIFFCRRGSRMVRVASAGIKPASVRAVVQKLEPQIWEIENRPISTT